MWKSDFFRESDETSCAETWIQTCSACEDIGKKIHKHKEIHKTSSDWYA